MSKQPPVPDTMTLQASLEAVARLGESYLLEGSGDELTASELLKWLHSFQPQALPMPVHLVLPDHSTTGGIYEVGPHGEVLANVPLYHIERRARNTPYVEGALQANYTEEPPQSEALEQTQRSLLRAAGGRHGTLSNGSPICSTTRLPRAQ